MTRDFFCASLPFLIAKIAPLLLISFFCVKQEKLCYIEEIVNET